MVVFLGSRRQGCHDGPIGPRIETLEWIRWAL
jgi:hypothetical protein